MPLGYAATTCFRFPMKTAATSAQQKTPLLPLPVLLLLGFTTILHVALVFRFPLAPDETYYWEWSRRGLDWGYYDQGPMIAWVIRAFCSWMGDTELAIRMPTLIASLCGQLFMYFFSRDLFGPRVAFWSLWPLAFTPFALAGGFVATYDPLVVMFWAMALYFVSRAIFFGNAWAWLAFGFALGFGMLSKYTMFLFLPCLALFCFTIPEYRRLFFLPKPWLAIFIGFAILAPNIFWMSQHDWITVSHVEQLTASRADKPLLTRIGSYLGTQAGLITPVLFFLTITSLFWTARRTSGKLDPRRWFLFCFSAPILLFFGLETFRGSVLPNWPILGWLTVPTAIAAWVEHANNTTKRARSVAYASSIVVAVIFSLLIVYTELLATVGIQVPIAWTRQVNRMFGGRELAAAADRVKRDMELETNGRVAVAGTHYDTSSRLAFYMEGKPLTLCLFLGTRLNQYMYWNRAVAPNDGDAMLIVGDYPIDSPKRPPYEKLFDRVVQIDEPVPIYRRPLYDEPVHTYYIYRCYGFRFDESAISPRIER